LEINLWWLNKETKILGLLLDEINIILSMGILAQAIRPWSRGGA